MSDETSGTKVESKTERGGQTREQQVLVLAAKGFTDKEIASQLGISRETVSTYWRRIRQRMGASSRTEAVAQTLRKQSKQTISEITGDREQLLFEIAERKRAEEDLTALTTQLRTLIDSLPSAVVFENEDREVQTVNHGFAEMFSFGEPEGLIGHDANNLYIQIRRRFSDPDGFLRRILNLVEEGRASMNEELRMLDGRILERDFIPVSDEGRSRGYLWHYRDVTQRKLAEDAISAQMVFEELVMMVSARLNRSEAADLVATIEEALERVARFVEADSVSLCSLADGKPKHLLRWTVNSAVETKLMSEATLELLADQLMAGRILAIDDVDEADADPVLAEAARQIGARSVCLLPLMCGQKTAALAMLSTESEPKAWEDELGSLIRLGSVLAAALDRARLAKAIH